jgi:lambda repressor-like predicted transcriptional regulator
MEMDMPTDFAAWLVAEMRRRHLSLRTVSNRTGLHYSTISRLRRGTYPLYTTALAIYDGLGYEARLRQR